MAAFRIDCRVSHPIIVGKGDVEDLPVERFLWTQNYDFDNREFYVEAYVALRSEMTIPDFLKTRLASCFPEMCISIATPDDMSYFKVLGDAVYGGYQPQRSSPIDIAADLEDEDAPQFSLFSHENLPNDDEFMSGPDEELDCLPVSPFTPPTSP